MKAFILQRTQRNAADATNAAQESAPLLLRGLRFGRCVACVGCGLHALRCVALDENRA